MNLQRANSFAKGTNARKNLVWILACSGIFLVMMVVLVVAVGSKSPSNEMNFGAYDACKSFVKEQLKSPASADFPVDDGTGTDVSVFHDGNAYTVVSHVDADNLFGTPVRSVFSCHTHYHKDTDSWSNDGTTVHETQ